MAIITKVPTITTALAIHGFMAKHRSLFVLRMQSHQGVCPARQYDFGGRTRLTSGIVAG
jgi:hypothetical protein